MPGYILVDHTQLDPLKENGIQPYREIIGILDFLREISEEEFQLPRFAEIRLVGLDDVLFAAGSESRELAKDIHRRLQRAASNMEKKNITIQVVFKEAIRRGNTLWVDYRGERLPIDVIFDSPLPNNDARGNISYRVHFNLTSPNP
jgi:hypothetical protein